VDYETEPHCEVSQIFSHGKRQSWMSCDDRYMYLGNSDLVKGNPSVDKKKYWVDNLCELFNSSESDFKSEKSFEDLYLIFKCILSQDCGNIDFSIH
jgi:hypothetical protein